jgi:hypothetical protein
LLQQVPLTVSPFVTLPAATTLSYNYKTIPSSLPPSSIGVAASAGGMNDESSEQNKPKYVMSQTGHAAHPSDILSACRALQAHVNKLQEDAERELREFEERIKARELAEKRRVAPGWLDSDARLLEPERGSGAGDARADLSAAQQGMIPVGASEMATDQGVELDRAFGGMALK